MNLDQIKTLRTTLTARYSETDSMSYVHHSNYLKYFEIGRLACSKILDFLIKNWKKKTLSYLLLGPILLSENQHFLRMNYY